MLFGCGFGGFFNGFMAYENLPQVYLFIYNALKHMDYKQHEQQHKYYLLYPFVKKLLLTFKYHQISITCNNYRLQILQHMDTVYYSYVKQLPFLFAYILHGWGEDTNLRTEVCLRTINQARTHICNTKNVFACDAEFD
eukprot:TRINITY_DN328_c1_g2_i5.p13 TRINITY_DN328_c1_g2~~TRINITY_DN328_c1_g2_i5.p13  ORF type:complete len:138 (-),score=7.00 TRINITY_DN328_c1_g2_i5:344-757(-)